MEKQTGRILKSSNVTLEGRVCLDACQNNTGLQQNERNVSSAPAQVRIAEKNPEFAVIELTCSCGVKTHIRCDYTESQSTEKETVSENNGENENES